MKKSVLNFGMVVFLSVVIALAFAGCGSESVKEGGRLTEISIPDTSGGSGKLIIMASTPIIADWVSEVGGQRIEAKAIVPAGINPHGYQPGAKTLTEIAISDAVFFVGLGYEGLWMTKLMVNNDNVPFTKLGGIVDAILTAKHDEHDEDDQGILE